MTVAALVLRVVLAVVFAAAGIGKSLSFRATVTSAVGFGVPRRLAPATAVVLPVVELAVAGGLVGRAASRPAAAAGAALLLGFTLATATAVARGRAVSCNCFGALSGGTVTGRTVVRNVVLFAVAAAAATITGTESDPSGLGYDRFGGLAWAVFVLALLVGLLSAVFGRVSWLLLTQHGRLLRRIDELTGATAGTASGDVAAAGPPPGTEAPAFTLYDLASTRVSLADLTGRGKPVALVFSDPGCGPCGELAPSVSHWQRQHSGAASVALVATGTREANAAKAAEHGLDTVLLDADGAVALAYGVTGTPSAVLVDAQGRVAAPLAVGAQQIESLVGSVLGHVPSTDRSTIVGTPAPEFRLVSTAGDVVTHEFFRHRAETVVLFWNSACGFCQHMRGRLQQWDLAGFGGPRALVVVTADRRDVAEPLRLNAPVLHDEDGSVMRAFGVSGTPIAVLVDSSGAIASEQAPGEQAVFDLLGNAEPAGRERLPLVPGGNA